MADEEVKPCCARLANQGWCVLPDGHRGTCKGFEGRAPLDTTGLYEARGNPRGSDSK